MKMRRRRFIGLVGAAATWPLAARAQQPIPVVGYLSGIAASDRPHHTEAFRQGLNEIGYAEGRNVSIEYRYADNQMDRLQPMAADLIARKVAVIAAIGGNNTALITKTLTSTIPIVFTSGLDPVKAGLVASLNRPEANVTGVSWFSVEMGQKHIEVLRELLPQAALIALLLNPSNPEGAFYEQSAQEGARARARTASTDRQGRHGGRNRRRIRDSCGAAGERRDDRVGPFFNHPRPATRRAVGAACCSDDLSGSRVARGRRPDQLRKQRD
jgi:hypothetical protein